MNNWQPWWRRAAGLRSKTTPASVLAKWVDVERLAKSVADLGLGVRGIQNERSAVMLEGGVRDIVSWISEPSCGQNIEPNSK
jgi:hypothetical protein